MNSLFLILWRVMHFKQLWTKAKQVHLNPRLKKAIYTSFLALELPSKRALIMPYQLHAVSQSHRQQKLFKQKYQETQSLNIILNLLSLKIFLLDAKRMMFLQVSISHSFFIRIFLFLINYSFSFLILSFFFLAARCYWSHNINQQS